MEYNSKFINIKYALDLLNWYMYRITELKEGDKSIYIYLGKINLLNSIFYDYVSDQIEMEIKKINEKY